MQFTEVLTLPDAVIGNVKVKNDNGSFETTISIRGWLTPGLADIAGLRSTVYADNDTPRPGFTYIEDNTAGCESFRAVLEVEGLKQSCEVNGAKVDGVAVEREDGTLWLHIRLKCSSDPLPFFEYWRQIGSASGMVKVVPLQMELEVQPAESQTGYTDEQRPLDEIPDGPKRVVEMPDRSHENRPKGGRRGRKAHATYAPDALNPVEELLAEDGGDPVQEPEPEEVVIQ